MASSWIASHAQERGAADSGHTVPMFPAAKDEFRQGFVRVINRSARSGEVEIRAIDDDGTRFGPSTLSIDAGETVHFNSADLEEGSASKGLPDGVGSGTGDWRLNLESVLDIEVLAYIRTVKDGFLTAMHDTVLREGDRHRVATFNPGANVDQVSLLRLINAGNETAEVTITGIDGTGEGSSGRVSVSVSPGKSRTLTAQELEAGGAGFNGELGDGAGKWQLIVESEQPITVVSLLSSPTGHLTNLSTAPALDFAPSDPTAFDDRIVGRRLVGDDPAGHVDFLADRRFRETEGSEVYEGTYTYSSTGRNQARVVLDYDDGNRCTYTLTFRSRTAGSLSFRCSGGENGESAWRLVELPPHGDSEDAYCRPDGRIGPGESCGIRDTPFRFEVDSSGRSCIQGGGFTHCDENRQECIDKTINGVRFTLVAVRNPDGSWTIEQVNPKPPGDSTGVGEGFELHSANGRPTGIVYANARYYITDSFDDKVYAYYPAGDRDSGSDFELDAQSDGPQGIAFAAGRFFVVDALDDWVYAYTESGERDAEADFDLDADNARPLGIAHADEALYVVESALPKVYGYRLSGQREPDFDFDLDAENADPAGITYAEGRFYVVDDDQVYAYRADGERDPEADFGLAADNESPGGIAHVKGGFYVVDQADGEVYAYSSDGPDLIVYAAQASTTAPGYGAAITFIVDVRNRGDATSAATLLRVYRSDDDTISGEDDEVGARSVVALDAGQKRDIAIEVTAAADSGTHYYGSCIDAVAGELATANNCSVAVRVEVQGPDLVVESVSVDDRSLNVDEAFTLRATVRNRGERPSAATTVRYYRSRDSRIRSTDIEVGKDALAVLAGSESAERSIGLATPGTTGFHYYGACVDTVPGEPGTGDNCSTAVRISVGGRGEAFSLHGDNYDPDGIAYSEGRFYVINGSDQKVYAYEPSGERDASADFDLDVENGRPTEIAFANDRFHVVDIVDDKAYAYTGRGQRDVAADFDLVNANGYAVGLGSAGDRILVVDERDRKVYAYLESGRPDLTHDFDLAEENGAANGIVYANDRFYVVDRVDDKVYAYWHNGRAAPASDFDLHSDNRSPGGITYAQSAFHVIDELVDEVYSYSIPAEPDGPDLIVQSPSVDDAEPGAGGRVAFTATVRNRGNRQADATTLRFYRSEDVEISTKDTELDQVSLDGLSASSTSRISADLAVPTDDGCYFCGACVELVDGERADGNNCSRPVEILVGGRVDLEVSRTVLHRPSTALLGRSTISMTVEVTNSGLGSSRAARLQFTGGEIRDIPALNPNGSVTFDEVRVGTAQRGTRSYTVCIADVPCEEERANNCSSRSVTYR